VVKDSSEWIRGAVECVRALIGGCRGLGEGGKAEAVKAAMRVILEAVEGVSRFRDRRAGAGSGPGACGVFPARDAPIDEEG